MSNIAYIISTDNSISEDMLKKLSEETGKEVVIISPETASLMAKQEPPSPSVLKDFLLGENPTERDYVDFKPKPNYITGKKLPKRK